jgi:hypothetical protein
MSDEKQFDVNRIAWGLPDSPVSQLCSYCFAKVGDLPLRLWKEDSRAAVFCRKCEEPAIHALLGFGQRRK